MDEIADRILSELSPPDDWWKSDTPEVIREAAITMLHHNMDEDTVEETLYSVVQAMREEYGQ